jgi:general secretion pathway protein D
MMKKQPSLMQNAIILLATATCFVNSSGFFPAGFAKTVSAGQKNSNPIYNLKYISAEQGRKFLNDAGIGTATTVPGSCALLVTAPTTEEMEKARNILNLVDKQDKYVVHKLNLTSSGQIDIIQSKIDDLKLSGTKAMVETYNQPDGQVIIIVPLTELNDILQTMENPAKSPEPAAKPIDNDNKTLIVPNQSPLMLQANLNQELLSERITQSSTAESSREPTNGPKSRQTTGIQTEQQLTASSLSIADPEIPNANNVLQLNLPAKLTLAEFLGFVGPSLQMDFAYDATQFVGDITLNLNGKLQGSVTVKEVYSYLKEVLKFRGFVMTRGGGNLVKIVPKADVLNIDPAIVSSENPRIQAGDIVLITYFELKYIDTSSAENLLKDMQLTINITSIAERQTIIVTAYAEQIKRIKEVLNLIDKPGKKTFRSRQLRYTIAQTIAPKLQTLAEQIGAVSITIATTTTETTIPQPQRLPTDTDTTYTAKLNTWRAQMAALANRTATAGGASQTATGPTVHLDYDDRTNRILMIGRGDQLDQLDELIDTLDVEQQDLRTLQIYKIKHLDAADVREKLAELGVIPSSKTNTGTTSTSKSTSAATKPVTTPQPIPTTTVTTTASGEKVDTLAGEPQVVLVEATNSLLVSATKEQHLRIAAIIDHVDNEVEQIPYKIYQLKNQDPNEVKKVLEQLVQDTVTDPQSKIQRTESKLEEKVTIVADSTTCSLIVYASKKNQDWIGDLIERLDKRRPQVLIDVTLVEISKTDAFNYDLNIIQSFPDLTSTSGLTTALMSSSSNKSPISTLTSSGRDRFVDFQSKNGEGTGFYGDRHINALLTAMQEKSYGRVMAKPKILVNDNQLATISTTDTTYIKTTSSTPYSSSNAGTNTNMIETATSYDPYDAGITLKITPHISESNLLRLEINLVRSDFVNVTDVKPPDTAKSDVTTNVTIPDGSTIILGGMIKLNQSKGDSKVPLLGDIPFIGGLFRSISNNNKQTNLYVFVKAEVIRPNMDNAEVSDLQRISDENRKSFEESEDSFQKHQSWPGITSKQVEPFKVLEAK